MSTELNTGQDLEEGLESAENAAKASYEAARTVYDVGKKIGEAAKTAGEAAGEAATGAGAEAAGQAAAAGAEAGAKAAAAGAEAGAEAAGQAAVAGAEAGAEAAAATAGGVATGGVSTAVVAALEAAKTAKRIVDKVHEYEEEATSTELGRGSHWTFKVVLIALLGWFLCCAANLEKLVPGSMEEFQEKEYAADKAYADNLRTGTRTEEFEEKEEFDRRYNNKLFLTNGFNAYIDGLDGFDGGGPGPMADEQPEEFELFGQTAEEDEVTDNSLFTEHNTGDIKDQIANIAVDAANVFSGAIDAITGELLKIPGIGELVNCSIINDDSNTIYQLIRSSTDSYSMEFTLKKAMDYSIIGQRIAAAESLASGSNIGTADQLYTLNKNGENYYVGALIDGFATPGGAYKVTLNTGATFNMVAVDVKSLNDKVGSGGTGQVDTSYGHGYIVNGGKNVQMNICEFIDANTSSKSIAHSSATNYSNAPMPKDSYVVSVESLGAF